MRARYSLQLGRCLGRSELAPPLCLDIIRNPDDASPHRRLHLARTVDRGGLDSHSNLYELDAGPSCRGRRQPAAVPQEGESVAVRDLSPPARQETLAQGSQRRESALFLSWTRVERPKLTETLSRPLVPAIEVSRTRETVPPGPTRGQSRPERVRQRQGQVWRRR